MLPLPRIELGGRGLVGGSPELEARLVWGVKNAEDARRKVQRIHEAGAGWLALHDADGFAAEELHAIADEASKVGLRLFASGDGFDEIRAAVPAGAESLELPESLDRGGVPRGHHGALRSSQGRDLLP